MTRDVVVRKLGRLRVFLDDLASHRGRDSASLAADPYEAERLLELVVQVVVDILQHELTERGVVPETYRDAFLKAGTAGLIPDDLAQSLSRSAGLRNVLVHAYEDIDYELVAVAIERALDDVERFFEVYRGRLAGEEG
jgi:uncharacterized protein YutE (UPF0331/DUF86 family)